MAKPANQTAIMAFRNPSGYSRGLLPDYEALPAESRFKTPGIMSSFASLRLRVKTSWESGHQTSILSTDYRGEMTTAASALTKTNWLAMSLTEHTPLVFVPIFSWKL